MSAAAFWQAKADSEEQRRKAEVCYKESDDANMDLPASNRHPELKERRADRSRPNAKSTGSLNAFAGDRTKISIAAPSALLRALPLAVSLPGAAAAHRACAKRRPARRPHQALRITQSQNVCTRRAVAARLLRKYRMAYGSAR